MFLDEVCCYWSTSLVCHCILLSISGQNFTFIPGCLRFSRVATYLSSCIERNERRIMCPWSRPRGLCCFSWWNLQKGARDQPWLHMLSVDVVLPHLPAPVNAHSNTYCATKGPLWCSELPVVRTGLWANHCLCHVDVWASTYSNKRRWLVLEDGPHLTL